MTTSGAQDNARTSPVPPVSGISVIVPAYNGSEWIESSLRSVLDQKSPVPLEVVVVDDCSTDNTLAIVRSLNDPRVVCLSTGRNSGVAAARNVGVRAARFDWLAFNDQDDVWCPDRLEKQVALLRQVTGAIGVAGGAVRLAADGRSAWTGRFLGFRWTPTLDLKRSDPPFYDPIRDGVSYLQTLIIARPIALSAGGFNEGLPLADDVDFAMKCARLGRMCWLAEPVFLYRLGHHNQTAPSVAKADTFIAAQAYVYAAHAARMAGQPEPDVGAFMKAYRPSQSQYTDFEMRQKIRYINTVWVYKGLWQAVVAGVKVFLGHPWLFSRHLSERVRYWMRRAG